MRKRTKTKTTTKPKAKAKKKGAKVYKPKASTFWLKLIELMQRDLVELAKHEATEE
jgi:hypothetical protein